MRDDEVGAGVGHPLGLRRIEDVGRREQVHLAGEPDDVDLELVAHAGFLERLAHVAVEEADRREVLDAGEAQLRSSSRKSCGMMNGSVPLTPASTGVRFTTGRTS